MSLRTFSECSHAFGNAATATIAVVPAVPGRRVAIFRLAISNAAVVGATIQDTTGAAISQQFQLPASNMPMIMETQSNNDPWWVSSPGTGVQIAQSGTVNIGFDVWYIQS